MACLVEVPVEVAGQFSVCFGRYDGTLASGREWGDDPLVGIENLVRDQRVGLHRWQEIVGAQEIVGLSSGQEKACRIAERVDQRVDLGA